MNRRGENDENAAFLGPAKARSTGSPAQRFRAGRERCAYARKVHAPATPKARERLLCTTPRPIVDFLASSNVPFANLIAYVPSYVRVSSCPWTNDGLFASSADYICHLLKGLPNLHRYRPRREIPSAALLISPDYWWLLRFGQKERNEWTGWTKVWLIFAKKHFETCMNYKFMHSLH